MSGDLTVGPDGNLWFPYENNNSSGAIAGVGRITPAGTFTVFPLPAPYSAPGGLTVGPDGALWFGELGGIGRIMPSGVITVFALPDAQSTPGDLTVGPDGALWFPENQTVIAGLHEFYAADGKIGKVDPSQLHFTGVVAVAHSGRAIRSIVLGFNEPLDPSTAASRSSYSLAVERQKRHTLVFAKRVKIGRVSYDSATNTVSLKLATPQKGPLQVTVPAGVIAAGEMFDLRDFTAVVE